jgi:Zn-dependent protease
LTDQPKFDPEENQPRLPDENAADSFFAMLEQNTRYAEPIDVIPASDICVTPSHLLELQSEFGNQGGAQPGGQLDLVAEPPTQRRPVVLHPIPQKPPGINWQTPLILYIATWYSVAMAGKQFDGKMTTGLLFAFCVMTILTCHELGHYIQTRRYRIRSSLPYFIPLPIPGAIFGTMGAIIKMDGRIPNRRVLFDIGISGPLAGLVPTLIFCVIGVQQAQVGPIIGDSLQFGDPLLFQWLSRYVFGPIPDEMTLYINPIGMAGWFGLFLTSLNLFPLGQLDGGHVFYAILGKRAPNLSVILYTLIVAYVIFAQAYVWLVMLVLIYLMNPRHPPTQNDEPSIGVFRTVLGIATLAFIIIGFTVNPISFTAPGPQEMELLVWLGGF